MRVQGPVVEILHPTNRTLEELCSNGLGWRLRLAIDALQDFLHGTLVTGHHVDSVGGEQLAQHRLPLSHFAEDDDEDGRAQISNVFDALRVFGFVRLNQGYQRLVLRGR